VQNTLSTYDLMGRLLSSCNVVGQDAQAGPATVETVMQYNAYGELAAKGSKLKGAAMPSQLQEFFKYNKAGQLEMSNAGDGVARISLYDAAGNLTLSVRSAGALDLRPLSLAELDVESAGGNWLDKAVATISVFDAGNRVVRSLQPRHGVDNILQQIAAHARAYDDGSQGARLTVATGANGGNVLASAAGQVLGVGGSSGKSFSYTVKYDRTTHYKYTNHEDNDDLLWRERTDTAIVDRTLSMQLGALAPSDIGLGSVYELELTAPNGQVVASASGTADTALLLHIDRNIAPGGHLRLYQRANAGAHGRVLLAESEYHSAPPRVLPKDTERKDNGYHAGEEDHTVLVTGGSSLQEGAQPPALRLVGLPATTAQVQIGYRVKGSSRFSYLPMTHPGMYAANGSPAGHYRPDVFDLNLGVSGHAGVPVSEGVDYEYVYVASDAAGLVVGGAGGSFRIDPATGQVLVGAAQIVSAAVGGGALVMPGDAAGYQPNLVFFDQGRQGADAAPSGAHASVRFRRLPLGSWETGQLGAVPLTGLSGPNGQPVAFKGSYSWILPSGGELCDYVITVTDDAGNIVSQNAGQVQLGAEPTVQSYGRLQDRPQVVRIDALPAGTTSVRLHYQLGGMPTEVDAVPSAGEPGVFLWDLQGAPAGDYAYRLFAYDGNGAALGGSTGVLRLGQGAGQTERHSMPGTPLPPPPRGVN
jgi:hypothetical protein